MRKNNNGFTLIELLAIIVILAIIAVITVPIILNIIENSRKGAAIDSAYGYKDAISKYYVSEMIDNQDLKLDGAYSIDNGTLKKGSETPIQIPTSGDSPSVGWIKIKENEVTKGCLTISDYKVQLKDKDVTAEKGVCDSTMPPVKFDEETPWKDIVEALQDGDPIKGIEVGKEKKVELNGFEGTSTLRIANLPSEESIEEKCGTEGFSETACGFVLEFANIITYHVMNAENTNVGGWEASEMRIYVNDIIYNALPDEIKNAIIPTTVISGHGSTNEESNFITEDWLYLLSPVEIWGNNVYSNVAYDAARDNTRQLDYYKSKGVTTSSYDDVIKEDNKGSLWWLRTSASDYDTHFFLALKGMPMRSNGNADYGVSPAFRIAEKITME